MTEHYYSQTPTTEHDEKTVIFETLGVQLKCVTDSGVFSRDGLDMGTRILIDALPQLKDGMSVLDLGCGWGPVGVALGKKYPGIHVTMSDINERAAELSKRNLEANGVSGAEVFQGDGFENTGKKYDLIALNPPIRAGKKVIYDMFSGAREHLADNGTLYIVIRKQQGAESAQRFLQSIYGCVERVAREKGYWVLCCTMGAGPSE